MKKLLALILVLILIFPLCACNSEQLPDDDSQQTTTFDPPADTKYKLTVIDYWGYLVEPLNEYYKAGEEVEVHLMFLSGPAVGIDLNGKYIGENSDTKHVNGHPVITFTMPAEDSILYTTQNGNIGFKSTFSRANFQNFYTGALNVSKLQSDSLWHLPIYKFDTLADLEKFKSDFGGTSGFNHSWDEVPSFNEVTQDYDDSFFERYTLMLVYVESSSGSYRFGFKDILINGNCLCVQVEQTNNPVPYSEDMASWFITVAVPDSMIADFTEFDAVMNNENLLPWPGTALEFWIGENVDDFDFSEHQEKSGMFGGHEYYGKGYAPTVDEYGQQNDPEKCVLYTVTSYPDYSNKEQHVTGIYITDPAVSFYGISLDSSFEEFERLIEEKGFEVTESDEHHRTASKGKYSITITKEHIVIRVHVENRYGIVF